MAFYNILLLGKAIITSFKDNSFRKKRQKKNGFMAAKNYKLNRNQTKLY